jgi:transketolase
VEEKISYLKKKAFDLRNATLDLCSNAGTGHVASSFSCTDILTTLYYGGILRYDVKDPSWEKRDRFLLSKGHSSPVFYNLLADVGYFPKEWIKTFCKQEGKFGVHMQNNIPGVEMTSGSLGHGLGIGAGMALAARMNREDYFVFALISDGECYEGSTWESAMFAGHHHLNNFIVFVDRNGICATDFTENCLRLNPLEKKFEAFGWETKKVNGHSIEELMTSLEGFRSGKRDKPYIIIADTIKGKGSSYIENQVKWHTKTPNLEEAEIIKKELKESYQNG